MERAAPRPIAEAPSSSVELRRAIALHRNGEIAQAAQVYAQVLAQEPDNPDAAHLLGVVRLQQGRPAEALGLIAAALKAKPRSAGILSNHGLVLEALGRLEEAIANYDLALAHKPQDAEILGNRGKALFRLGRFEDALASYALALEHAPDNADIRWDVGLIRLLRGELREGWDGYEWRWRRAQFPDRDRAFAAPRWHGDEPIAGRTILLHAEQGLGDTIQFVRYAPLVAARGARVILEVQPSLRTLLSDFPGVSQIVARGEALPDFDRHCPLLSLPRALGTDLRSIPARPYLSAPAARVTTWQARLPATSRPRVGLAWAGNPRHADDRNRSLPFGRIARLLSLPGIDFVSLQKDAREPDRAALRGFGNVLDLGDELGDFADTAAVIDGLDLVICVDTAVAHLAGALGKPLWILLPFVPDWRWLLDRDDSPWYPVARLFRQPKIGDWDSVIVRVRDALADWAAARRDDHAG